MAYRLSVREDQKSHPLVRLSEKKNHKIENMKGTSAQEEEAVMSRLASFLML